MEPIGEQAVLKALSGIEDPTFGRSLVSLESISGIRVTGTAVTLRIRLNSPAHSVRNAVGRKVEEALESIGLDRICIDWDIRVPTRDVLAEDPIPDVRNVVLVMSGKGGV